MGEAAEKMAKQNRISRAEQDAIAHRSHTNAARAWRDGTYAAEVMHVIPPPYDKPVDDATTWSADDSTLEAYAKLSPAFDRRHGTITAGNASPLTDGASALLLMREGEGQGARLPAARVRRVVVLRGGRPWLAAPDGPGARRAAGARARRPLARATWTSSTCTRPSPPRSRAT